MTVRFQRTNERCPCEDRSGGVMQIDEFIDRGDVKVQVFKICYDTYVWRVEVSWKVDKDGSAIPFNPKNGPNASEKKVAEEAGGATNTEVTVTADQLQNIPAVDQEVDVWAQDGTLIEVSTGMPKPKERFKGQLKRYIEIARLTGSSVEIRVDAVNVPIYEQWVSEVMQGDTSGVTVTVVGQ